LQLRLALSQHLNEPVSSSELNRWWNGDFEIMPDHDPQPQTELVEILYLVAGARHETGFISEALTLYRAILSMFQDSHRTLDLQFRTALALSELNQHGAGLQLLRRLGPRRALTPLDKNKIRLTHMTFRFRARPSLHLIRRIDRFMRPLAANELTQDRARLRTAFVRFLQGNAAAYPFIGSQNRIVRNHRKREQLHQLEIVQLQRAITLKKPLWVGRILALVGQGLLEVGDDLLDAPIPNDVTPSQLATYRDLLHTYVEASWLKALRYVNEGLHLATRLGLSKDLVHELGSLKEAIALRLETSGASTDRDQSKAPAE